MEETRYIISDASKLVNVEQHTLRYWEEELELIIPRNELGHRYYREEDIALLKKIKELKDQGFQLKAIKMCIPDMDKLENLDPVSLLKLRDAINEKETQENQSAKNQSVKSDSGIMEKQQASEVLEASKSADRMGQFRNIMTEIISDVLKQNNVELSDTVSMNVSNSVIKEMDYVIRMKEEREEERYRQLDRTIREIQSSKTRSAVAKEKKAGKKRGLFRNNKSFA